MNTLQAGISLSLLTLPLIVTGPLFGALSDRLGRKPVIVALMLGGSVTPLLIVSAGSGLSLMLVLFIVGTVMYAVTSVMQAAALDIVEGQRLEGTFIGLSWAFNSVFNSVSLALAGILTQLLDSGRLFTMDRSWPSPACSSPRACPGWAPAIGKPRPSPGADKPPNSPLSPRSWRPQEHRTWHGRSASWASQGACAASPTTERS